MFIMEAAAEQTIQNPSKVLSELKAAMAAEDQASPQAVLSGTVPEPPVTGGRESDEKDLFEAGPAPAQAGLPTRVTVSSALSQASSPTQKRGVRHIPASAALPHRESSVRKWVGSVRPHGDKSLIDLDAGDELAEDAELYAEPVPEEELPSDAGSVRSELAMFRVYTERQFEESRKYTEDQMRSTHDLLTRIETRLSLLEKKVNLPASRPVSVQLPTGPPKPPIQSVPGSGTSVAAKQASSSSATFGGITELPPYSPNKTIQARTLNRLLKDKGLSLQPISRAITRRDWTLQYINSLPVFHY